MPFNKFIAALGATLFGIAVVAPAYAYAEGRQASARAFDSIQQRGAGQASATARTLVDENSLSGLPLVARAKMVYSLEEQFTQLLGAPYTIATVTVSRHGTDYLFCGSGAYGHGQGGVFIFDTAPDGVHDFHADKQTFIKSGCGSNSAVMLR